MAIEHIIYGRRSGGTRRQIDEHSDDPSASAVDTTGSPFTTAPLRPDTYQFAVAERDTTSGDISPVSQEVSATVLPAPWADPLPSGITKADVLDRSLSNSAGITDPDGLGIVPNFFLDYKNHADELPDAIASEPSPPTANGDALNFDGIDQGAELDISSLPTATLSIFARANPTDVDGPPQVVIDVDGLRVSEYDDEVIAQIQNGDPARTSWSKSGDVGTGPRGLAVYDGKLYVACRGSDDVFTYGNGRAVRLARQVGSMPIVAQDDGGTLILRVGSSETSESHTTTRSQNGTYTLGLGKGSTQSGLYGGADEDLEGTISRAGCYPQTLTATQRDALASAL